MEPYSAYNIKRKKRKIHNSINFDIILKKVFKSQPGIKKVILVDKTGKTIASVSKFSYFSVAVDSIGATVSAIFCASEEQGKNLELGRLEIITSEFENGKIIASNFCSDAVLTLICDSDLNIGLIRLVLARAVSEVKDNFLLKFSNTLDFYDFSDL
ncbi:MAG: roadblock/LC7 domain-containing protein [Candidatus Lokiarchaeota archaeon]|nr:roadblock/LC7 domain-containing protein [Candidatus Lokiarchaeota archaeon]